MMVGDDSMPRETSVAGLGDVLRGAGPDGVEVIRGRWMVVHCPRLSWHIALEGTGIFDAIIRMDPGLSVVMSGRSVVYASRVSAESVRVYASEIDGSTLVLTAGGELVLDQALIHSTVIDTDVVVSPPGGRIVSSSLVDCDLRHANLQGVDIEASVFEGCVFGHRALTPGQMAHIAAVSPGRNVVVGADGTMAPVVPGWR